MAIGFFLDKEHQPSEEEIDQALGSSLPFWQHVIRFIDDRYAMPGPWSFGGKKYGWNRWYRQSGKSLVSLFPQKDYFVAQVVLGKDQVAQADQIELGSNVRQCLEQTPQLHDGRWLFIHAASEQDAVDIEALLRIKKKVKTKR